MVTSNIIRNKVGLVVGLMLFVSNACALSFKNETGNPLKVSWTYSDPYYGIIINEIADGNGNSKDKSTINRNEVYSIPFKSSCLIASVTFIITLNNNECMVEFEGKELLGWNYEVKLTHDANQCQLVLYDNERKKGVFQVINLK